MIFEVIIITFLVVYLYVKWRFNYWKRNGVPYYEPKFPFGSYNLPTPSSIHPAVTIKNHYDYFKSLGHKHFGVFFSIKPVYIPIDPSVIRQMMVLDYEYFGSRGIYCNPRDEPLSAGLTLAEGSEWKIRRQKLTPAFTSVKIKPSISDSFQQCCDQFVSAIDKKLTENHDAINLTTIIHCVATNIIGTGIFGFKCKSYENTDIQNDKENSHVSLSPLDILKWLIAYFNSSLARSLRITLFPKVITNSFSKEFLDTVQFRESTNFYRPDVTQHFINLKNQGIVEANKNVKFSLANHQMVEADAFISHYAAVTAYSTVINFCIFELAVHPNIQAKARDEVKRITEEDRGKFNYDNLMKMTYLDKVINETLRKYPPAPMLVRMCTKEYKVPNTNVTIEKGMYAIIPILALHNDPEYFPDPEKFDPERFADSNRKNIPPFTYLPFGEGPRKCIATRLALISVKSVIAATVQNFSFTLNEKTSCSPKFDPINPAFSFQNPILMDIKKL